MNRITSIFTIPKTIAIFLLLCTLSASNCSHKERMYKNKINGISYGRIHRMGTILTIAVSNIDTISQSALVGFSHCLEYEESKRGAETKLIDICNKYLYIDQLTPENLYVRVRFRYDTILNSEKRTIILQHLKPTKLRTEIEYNLNEIDCKLE